MAGVLSRAARAAAADPTVHRTASQAHMASSCGRSPAVWRRSAHGFAPKSRRPTVGCRRSGHGCCPATPGRSAAKRLGLKRSPRTRAGLQDDDV